MIRSNGTACATLSMFGGVALVSLASAGVVSPPPQGSLENPKDGDGVLPWKQPLS